MSGLVRPFVDLIDLLLDLIFSPLCPGCGEYLDGGLLCASCRGGWVPMEDSLHLGECERKILHKIKYGGRPELLAIFDEALPRFAPEVVLVPVPLHYERWRERGFNQAECLARRFPNRVDSKCLRKIRKTLPQSTLDRKRRLRQLRGAFECESPPRKVILIDDVQTTGATLDECARVLLKAGAEEVRYWTLFRA